MNKKIFYAIFLSFNFAFAEVEPTSDPNLTEPPRGSVTTEGLTCGPSRPSQNDQSLNEISRLADERLRSRQNTRGRQ